jgi:hypothetical protein
VEAFGVEKFEINFSIECVILKLDSWNQKQPPIIIKVNGI